MPGTKNITWEIVFDLDGVLLNSENNLAWLNRALRRTLQVHNLKVTEKNIKLLYPGKLRNFKEIVRDLEILPEKLWKTRNTNYKREKIKAMKNGEISPYNDVKALYRLKAYDLYIISNSPQEVVDAFVKEFNYQELFTAWVGRGSRLSDLKRMKPHPYLFEKLKQRIKEKKATFFYVGDRELDQQFAKNVGMTFLDLKRNESHPQNVNKFQNLREIIEYFKKEAL